MAVLPKITYNVIFQPEVNNTLSYIAPYNTCTVNFSANCHIKQFYCRATKGDDDWGYDKGELIAEYTNRPGNTQLSFDIIANNHLLEGDGVYRIGLYLQNDNNVWNIEELFLTTERDNTHKVLQTDAQENFMVSMGNPVTSLEFTCNAETTIDLSPLNGLNNSRIVWGDGVTTHSGSQHTYNAAGTYTIMANFQDVNAINNYFLYQNTTITSINFGALVGVKLIRADFMSGCTNLSSINISGFSEVTNLGANFLQGCTSLSSIDISVFNFTTMPNNFLANCSSITNISFSSWTNLKDLGTNFMLGMSSVTSLDLSTNTTIETIGAGFLRNCTSLITLYVPLKMIIPTLGGWGITTLTNIICGDFLMGYVNADVWKELKDKMKRSL